jgi:parallel beta helix pectate lyase-like protein
MKSLRFMFSVGVLSTIAALTAHAQATRTWVSGVGDDANPCSRTAPCKTFAGAISKTATGGEIDALDPGGFGALTITKSITIDGGPGIAGVLVSGTNGFTVNAGTSAVVTLRNLTFEGTNGTGLNGIQMLSAGTLHIEHCFIYGFGQNGIAIQPSTQLVDGSQVFIEDTTSQDNTQDGLYILANTTNVHVSVSHSRFTNNTLFGILSADFSRPTIIGGDVSGNRGGGVSANAATGTAYVTMTGTMVANNIGNGLQAGGGAVVSEIRMSQVSIYGNSAGTATLSNGTIASFGNNFNTGTGTPGAILTPQ